MSRVSNFHLFLVAFGLSAMAGADLALAQTSDDSETVEESAEVDEPADPADDIFLPSEEIQADSEISFPSDI